MGTFRMGLRCPLCDERPFSRYRLLALGPLRSFPCQSCGTRLSVGWPGSLPFLLVLAQLPVIAAFAALFYVGAAFGGLAAFIAFFGAMALVGAPLLWLYARFVPLVPRYNK